MTAKSGYEVWTSVSVLSSEAEHYQMQILERFSMRTRLALTRFYPRPV